MSTRQQARNIAVSLGQAQLHTMYCTPPLIQQASRAGMGITEGAASDVGAAVGELPDCVSSSVMDSEGCNAWTPT